MTNDQTSPPFDQVKAEAFAENILDALNHGALCPISWNCLS